MNLGAMLLAAAAAVTGPTDNPDDQFRGMWYLDRKAAADFAACGFNFVFYVKWGYDVPNERLKPDSTAVRDAWLDLAEKYGFDVAEALGTLPYDPYLRKNFPQVRADGSKNTYTDMANPEVRRIVRKITELNAATVPKDRRRFIGIMPASEVRDPSFPVSTKAFADAWASYSGGRPMPNHCNSKSPAHYTGIQGFPPSRVIPDDRNDFVFYKWFWKHGDGWNDYFTETAHAFDKAAGRRLMSFHDPAVRCPPVWGSGGDVAYLNQWTYIYPEPFNISFVTACTEAMARGRPGQRVLQMAQAISYRSVLAPIGMKYNGAAPEWLSREPDARYITTPPDLMQEAIWTLYSHKIDGILFHGWDSMVDATAYGSRKTSYRYTNGGLITTISNLFTGVGRELGPLFKALPESGRRIALLESFPAWLYAKRGDGGYANGKYSSVALAATLGGLMPYVLYDEEIARDGIPQETEVLLMPFCDVLTETTAAAVKAFQGRGGIVLADDNIAPEILPDGGLPSFDRVKRAAVDEPALRKAAMALKVDVKSRIGLDAEADRDDMLVRLRRMPAADYLFVINDRRGPGDYIGQWGLVWEKGLPNSGRVCVRRKAGAVYDLVRHKAVPFEVKGEMTFVDVSYETNDGRVFMVADAPLAPLEVSVRSGLVRVRSKDASLMIPIRVDVDGRAPFYGVVRDGVWTHRFHGAKRARVTNLADGNVAASPVCAGLSASVAEPHFAFRARYDCVHEAGLCDAECLRRPDEFEFKDGCSVGDGDFADFLRVSMGVKCSSTGTSAVVASVGAVTNGYEVFVGADGVKIAAADERMLHQAYYHLEDLMRLRRAPFLKFGYERRTPLFSPRMIHSGWGLDEFSDGYLLHAAHHGFDSILIYVWDAAEPRASEIRDLIARAKARGLDTYLYSRVNTQAFVHPDDPCADSVFDSTYGRMAAAFPEARGVLFVGESLEFPSRDERTCGLAIDYVRDRRPKGDKRPYPGWFPCRDYPKLIDAIRRSMHKVNPKLEVILWSYNWGYCDEAPRRELVAALPKYIPLLVTYEMFESYALGNGLPVKVADYSVAFDGPGKYFASEADEASRRGLKLYAMANTAGRTWDLGMVPYMPVPYQWKRRWDGLKKARRDWGLAGLVESHHFGWAPSFITELAKEAFTDGGMDFDKHIRLIAARDFGTGNAEAACAAWRKWSDAIRDTKPSSVNQGGPFRYGPAYPFNALRPDVTWADMSMSPMFVNPNYRSRASHEDNSDEFLRLETQLLDSVAERFMSGANAFWKMEGRKAHAMARLGEYMARTYITAANVKRGLMAERRKDENTVMELARREYENVRAACALVEADSSLGYEPRLGYRGDALAMRMKMKWMERHYFGGARTVAEPVPEMSVTCSGRDVEVKNLSGRDFERCGVLVVEFAADGRRLGECRIECPAISKGASTVLRLPFDPEEHAETARLQFRFEQFEYGVVIVRECAVALGNAHGGRLSDAAHVRVAELAMEFKEGK